MDSKKIEALQKLKEGRIAALTKALETSKNLKIMERDDSVTDVGQERRRYIADAHADLQARMRDAERTLSPEERKLLRGKR